LTLRGSSCCCAPDVSSKKETCNIGGILPRTGACAHAAPMISSGCPLSPVAT